MNICILFHSHAKISLKQPKSYNKRGKHNVLKNGEGCTSLSGHGRDFLEVEADRGWADQERLATASICSFLNDLPMVCVYVGGNRAARCASERGYLWVPLCQALA